MKVRLVIAVIALSAAAFAAFGSSGDGRGILGSAVVASAAESAPSNKTWEYFDESIKVASGKSSEDKAADFSRTNPTRLGDIVSNTAASVF